MKLPYMIGASGFSLALMVVAPTAVAEPLMAQKLPDLPESAFITQDAPEDLQAAFEARPWGSNCGNVVCSSHSLNDQWEKWRPKTDDPLNDIYNRNYSVGYERYLDTNLANNPRPTTISEGTYTHQYKWEDGYMVHR